jgi:biopolymer transport protein ExbD
MFKIPSPRREPFRLDLVPMINIVFLLLIFFMLTSTAIKSSQEVDLPEAVTSELTSERNVLIIITSKGQIEYEDKPISLDALLPLLEGELYEREKRIVEIQADKAVEFELFGNVIDIAKQAGAVDFVLATVTQKSSKK